LTEKSESDLNASKELVLTLEKQASDRTNIIIAANSFLFLPFATLVTSPSVNGYLVAIPIIICLVGIVLNTFLRISFLKHLNIRDSLTEEPTVKNYFKVNIAGKEESTFYDTFNQAAPILMFIAWASCLIFFILYTTGLKLI